MLDISIRNKREELRKKSVGLREIAIDETADNSIEIRDKQDEIYNRWKFYDKVIKSVERVNYEMQDQKNK